MVNMKSHNQCNHIFFMFMKNASICSLKLDGAFQAYFKFETNFFVEVRQSDLNLKSSVRIWNYCTTCVDEKLE